MASTSPAERFRSWISRLRRREPSSITGDTRSIPAAVPSAPPLPHIINARYQLEHLLGRGGTGSVYRARDLTLDRQVALKLVLPELLADSPARQRFRRDADILSRLQHPSIVEIFDFGTFANGGGFLAMELVRGEDLRRVLQRQGLLEPGHAMRILSAVGSALEAAHHAGVLHKDLKPENILLPANGAEAKVLDFGVAAAIPEDGGLLRDQAAAGVAAPIIAGTPAYLAPEPFRGAAFDARSDVFSLAVLAFEMLSGDLPFGRGSAGEIMLAHARGIPPMSESVPATAQRAIRTALDANPDRRPSSPQAFAHLLAASLSLS